MHIDLTRGIVPISRAASALAALIKQAGKTGGPIIITQKGYASAVLLSIEAYERLVGERADEQQPAEIGAE